MQYEPFSSLKRVNIGMSHNWYHHIHSTVHTFFSERLCNDVAGRERKKTVIIVICAMLSEPDLALPLIITRSLDKDHAKLDRRQLSDCDFVRKEE